MGLRRIKTSTGQRSIPPDSSPHSMRSNIKARESQGGRGMGGGMAKAQGPNKSPYKVCAATKSTLMAVQKYYKSEPKLSVTDNHIDVYITLPQVIAKIVQLDVQGDILIVQTETKDNQCHIECLLPFEASLTGHSYKDGILHITLEK